MAGRPAITVLVLVLVLAGCGGGTRAPGPVEAPAIATGLVLRSGGRFQAEAAAAAMLRPDESSWEYGRNDPRLNVGWSPPPFAGQFATMRTNDWLYTSNGRPREFSRTHIQTFTERAAR
jgi:hypothetical protein